jgi:phage terminase large subunit-like protein
MTTPVLERSYLEQVATSERAYKSLMDGASARELEALLKMWNFGARPKQLWPGGLPNAQGCGPEYGCGHAKDSWTTWGFIGGRGVGKTWTGANATHHYAMKGDAQQMHLIAPSPADYRDVMIEGPSGIRAIAPKWERPEYRSTKRLLEWPNGAYALCFSSHNPEALRGPQAGFIWADEVAAWTYGKETWDQAQFGLRLGKRPRQILTTTPKPYPWLKEVVFDADTHFTHATTYENLHNLAPTFRATILKAYEGTALGQQELEAAFVDAIEGALWSLKTLEDSRVRRMHGERRARCVVAIDPPAEDGNTSDECGIVVVVKDEHGYAYVVEDASLTKASPAQWASAALTAYYKWDADEIVAEVNNGGDMVRHVLHTEDRNVKVVKVRATRGKATRAAPISNLFERRDRRAFLLGSFPVLETQLSTWVPGVSKDSPDRLDAMVWAFTHLMLVEQGRLLV